MNKKNIQSPQADGSRGERISAKHGKYCNHDDLHIVKGTMDFLVCNDCNQVGETFGKSVSELRMDFPSKEFGL